MRTLLRYIRFTLPILVILVSCVSPAAYAESKIDCGPDKGVDMPFYSGNDIFFYDPCAKPCDTSTAGGATGEASLRGNDNLQKIFQYMVDKGLSKEQAAGVVGNISRESGGFPGRKQGRPATEVYPDPSGISSGWGLIQWTPGSKVIGIAKTAGITGDIALLSTQLDIIWWHMNNVSPTGVKGFINEYKTVKDVAAATLLYEQKMEGAGVPAMADRIAAANLAMTYTTDGTVVSAASGCECPAPGNNGSTADVLLDPGHSGVDKQGKEIDLTTKLYIGDSSNTPEKDQVFDVATKVKTTLEAKNYKVIMTKAAAGDYANFVQRAQKANDAHVQIAVSIHNTAGTFGDAASGWVTPQVVGQFRTNTEGKNITFDDATVAGKSAEYAAKFVTARTAAEGGAQVHALNFTGRDGLSPGNIAVVALLAKVPWVYNEVGQTGFNADKYAQGIANGIMESVKPGGGAGGGKGSCASGAAGGSAIQTAVNYAWPTYHKAPYPTKKKVYEAAVQKAIAAGKYVGGLGYPGVDCGGFVTRVMQDSGVDPDYNKGKGPTTAQMAYVESSGKYTEIQPTSTGVMKPGDIAISSSHTYMYVGPGLTGSDDNGTPAKFESDIASASVSFTGSGWRAPMAGSEKPADPSYRWFRLK